MKLISRASVEFVQDFEGALCVLKNVGQWMLESGKNPSVFWHPENMNRDFLFQQANAKETDFYVAMVDGKPAAAEVLEWEPKNPDWKIIDKGKAPQALYINWLCVDREFKGQGLPEMLIGFATELALTKNVTILRLDADTAILRLMQLYESLDFQLITTLEENESNFAYLQKTLSRAKN